MAQRPNGGGATASVSHVAVIDAPPSPGSDGPHAKLRKVRATAHVGAPPGSPRGEHEMMSPPFWSPRHDTLYVEPSAPA